MAPEMFAQLEVEAAQFPLQLQLEFLHSFSQCPTPFASPLSPSSPACCPVAPVPVQLPVGLHQNSNETQRSPICRCLNPYRYGTYLPYHAMPYILYIHMYVLYTYMWGWRTFAPRPIPLMSVNQGNCYFFNNFSLAMCLSRERLSYESQNPAQSQSHRNRSRSRSRSRSRAITWQKGVESSERIEFRIIRIIFQCI